MVFRSIADEQIIGTTYLPLPVPINHQQRQATGNWQRDDDVLAGHPRCRQGIRRRSRALILNRRVVGSRVALAGTNL
jgi:hypothetical protein